MGASSAWTAPDTSSLDGLCRTVFASLPRSDQRRWASLYVRGLVTVPERKSIRRIAEQVAGRSVGRRRSVGQCLQQFVNQSPWDWSPVRLDLARAAAAAMPPRAWVVQEVEFVKDGRHSVGVATQYAPAAQRACNVQLALATWLAGPDGWVPANWRLMLPPSWDADDRLRGKAHVPDAERHRPGWEHVLDSVDEMVESWDLPPRPVVADRRHDRRIEPLVSGLEERGVRYALRITDRTPVATSACGRPVRAGELLAPATRELVTLLCAGSPARTRWNCSAIMAAHAVVPAAPTAPRTGPGGCRPRRVVATWPNGRGRQADTWLTNLPTPVALELVSTLDVTDRGDHELTALRGRSGLDHFEGRSFRGWHHHVTLASVAHVHRSLRDLAPHALDPVG